MKTLDDPTNWKIACKMVVDVAVNDWQDGKPEKTERKLLEFVARELNVNMVDLEWRNTHAEALGKIYEVTREGIEQ